MAYVDFVQIVTGFAPADDLKRSVSTSTSVQSYASTLDGPSAKVLLSTVGIKAPLRALTVTTSAVASVYNTTDPIVFRGRRGGSAAAEAVRLTVAGGGETVQTAGGLEQVDQIDVPAMLLATGNLQFGLGDVIFEPMSALVVAGAAGTFKLRTARGIDRDLTMTSGEAREIRLQRVLRTNATFPLTVYIPEAI